MAKLIMIIEKLLILTDEGALGWQVADGSEASVAAALKHANSSSEKYIFEDDAFYAELPNGAVVFHLDSDRDIIITFLDNENAVVEQINVGYRQFAEFKTPAESLYGSARRNALGIDKRLDNLLRAP